MLGLFQLRTRIVEQYHASIATIQISQPTVAGANFDQDIAFWREQGTQRNSLGQVLVFAALSFPEVIPISTTFVVTYIRHRSFLNVSRETSR